MEEEASSDRLKVVVEESVEAAGVGLLVLAAESVAERESTASEAAVSKREAAPQGKKWKKTLKSVPKKKGTKKKKGRREEGEEKEKNTPGTKCTSLECEINHLIEAKGKKKKKKENVFIGKKW